MKHVGEICVEINETLERKNRDYEIASQSNLKSMV